MIHENQQKTKKKQKITKRLQIKSKWQFVDKIFSSFIKNNFLRKVLLMKIASREKIKVIRTFIFQKKDKIFSFYLV